MNKNKAVSSSLLPSTGGAGGGFLTIGILGLGEGRSTMSAVLNSKKWKLKTICDLNVELCKKRAKEFDFHHYTTNYDDLLNDPEIDVVAIYTPDHLHADPYKNGA